MENYNNKYGQGQYDAQQNLTNFSVGGNQSLHENYQYNIGTQGNQVSQGHGSTVQGNISGNASISGNIDIGTTGNVQVQPQGQITAINSGINLLNINTNHLSNEEQEKLINITNLQNSIYNQGNSLQLNDELMKDGRGERNLKRDLSDREKAELELKKWNNQQKKVIEKYSSN